MSSKLIASLFQMQMIDNSTTITTTERRRVRERKRGREREGLAIERRTNHNLLGEF